MKFPILERWLRSRKAGISDYKEVNRLLIKAGRRAAYDLIHASASLTRQGKIDLSEYYHNRANIWLGIFNPLDDGIHYRDELHQTIGDQKRLIAEYRQYFKDNNMDFPPFDSYGEDLPF